MRRLDELFTAWPFFGSRQMTPMLRAEGDRQPKARAPVDVQNGDRSAGAEAEHLKAGAGPQDFPSSPAQYQNPVAEQRLGRGYHLSSNWTRLPLFRRDH